MSTSNGNGFDYKDGHEERLLRLESSHTELYSLTAEHDIQFEAIEKQIMAGRNMILDKLDLMFSHLDKTVSDIAENIKENKEQDQKKEIRLAKVEAALVSKEKWAATFRKILEAGGIALVAGLAGYLLRYLG